VINVAILVIFPMCLAFAAFCDLFTMSIPNRISVILLGSFVVVGPHGLDLTQIFLHFAAGGTVFAACFCLFALNVMGGGDAKLLTASAIWFGLSTSLVAFLLYVSVIGGLLTLVVPVPHRLLTSKKIPYGVAIALGGLAAYPSSPVMQAAFAQLA
jgi:prepilin peptidase CpaA